MLVLVTGASGFVGLNIVQALLDEGHSVRAYLRPSARRDHLRRFAVQEHTGELSDARELGRAMAGVAAVIHCAGNTSCNEADWPALYATNVEGTRAVVAAAAQAGVRRLVYTSTTSTVGARNDPRREWDETTPLEGFRADSPYARTKAAAERIVLDANGPGLATLALNPAEVVGAFDHTLQWGRLVLAVCTSRIPFWPPGSATWCAADAVGRAHVAALSQGRPGARYILGGPHAGYTEFIESTARVAGVQLPPPDQAYGQHYYRALQLEALGPLADEKPAVEPYRMRVFKGHYHFDSTRARRELGYDGGTLEGMLRAAVTWYRENHWLEAA